MWLTVWIGWALWCSGEWVVRWIDSWNKKTRRRKVILPNGAKMDQEFMQKASNFQLPRHASDFEEDCDRWPWSDTSSHFHAFLFLGCKLAAFPILSPSALQTCISPDTPCPSWRTGCMHEPLRLACATCHASPRSICSCSCSLSAPSSLRIMVRSRGKWPIPVCVSLQWHTSKPCNLWREEALWFHWRKRYPMWECPWTDHHHPFWSRAWSERRLPCSSLWPLQCLAQTAAEIQDSWPPPILLRVIHILSPPPYLLLFRLELAQMIPVSTAFLGFMLATPKELGYSSKSCPFSCPCLRAELPSIGTPPSFTRSFPPGWFLKNSLAKRVGVLSTQSRL